MGNLSRRSERVITRAANQHHPLVLAAGASGTALSFILAWMLPTLIDPLFWLVGAPVGIALIGIALKSTISRRSAGHWLAGSSAAMTLAWFLNHSFLWSVYGSVVGVAMVVAGVAVARVGTKP
jgi:hypothetical protein